MVCTIQEWRGGRWVARNYTWALHDASLIYPLTWYRTRSIIGTPTRVRAVFAGDASHLGATSAWIYWKVTR